MEHLGPLAQTILWVALVTGIVWRFHKPLDGLLHALKLRIEAGSSVKAGPFELGQARSQGVAEQLQKTQFEANELLQAQSEEAIGPPPQAGEVRSRLFEAEDLALRAIQSEYGQPISRQISLGPDLEVDGTFTVDGQLNIVEVKHVIGQKRVVSIARRTLERFHLALQRNRWRRVKVVLVLVLHDATALEDARKQVQPLVSDYSFPIDVRCYTLSDLRSTFTLDAA